MQQAQAQVHLLAPQADQFRDAHPMAVGDQNHRGIAVAMTSKPSGGCDQPVDLGRGQVLPAAALSIGFLRRRSHGEWTFPKMISGAVVAGAFRTKLRLGPKLVTFPKKHFVGKVPAPSSRLRPRANRPTDARRQQRTTDRAIPGRAERALRPARFRRLLERLTRPWLLEIQHKPLNLIGSGNFEGLSPEPLFGDEPGRLARRRFVNW